MNTKENEAIVLLTKGRIIHYVNSEFVLLHWKMRKDCCEIVATINRGVRCKGLIQR